METFLPPEGITSLIWKGDTVLLIMRTSSSGEDCIRFLSGQRKKYSNVWNICFLLVCLLLLLCTLSLFITVGFLAFGIKLIIL
jgi:hypothetical protein